jgi:hypothetical protein
MTSLLQKINELDLRVDGLDNSYLQVQITTNSNDISTLQTNMQDKLTAGDNITITDNIISSTTTESISSKIFYASQSSDIHLSETDTSFLSNYNNVVKINTELYNFNNSNTITVLVSGAYKVEFCNTFFNNGYLDRGNFGSIVYINNTNDRVVGGLATCYIRNRDYIRHGSTVNSVYVNLTANDTISISSGVNKASAVGFNSSLSGYLYSTGSNILITYLD